MMLMARTILVVGDSESLRTMVRSYLAQEGFHVVTATNGRAALFVGRGERLLCFSFRCFRGQALQMHEVLCLSPGRG